MDGFEVPLGFAPSESTDGLDVEDGGRERELPRLQGQENQL